MIILKKKFPDGVEVNCWVPKKTIIDHATGKITVSLAGYVSEDLRSQGALPYIETSIESELEDTEFKTSVIEAIVVKAETALQADVSPKLAESAAADQIGVAVK